MSKYKICFFNNKEISIVFITQKGIDAFESEYFLSEDEKEKRESNKNRYTIAFGVITAAGVIFAIINSTLLTNNTSKEPQKIIIELQSKKLDSSLLPLKILPSSIHKDSLLKKK